ncbi:trypsin-like peptidase domain-containing protein [Georgenia satyanarayanai]|uniref:trypsin-like peptidase domain-containing protein n=1 Tax=Georgenia satyanarayanai TaxID=860221 RepID=UPI0012641AF1|nr:trypsin-like peptidase domain-containing protein [Georgenia satyanarayanai]
MSERPDEHEHGYPPSPAPRPEPYSVDEVAPRTDEDGAAPAPEPAAGPSPHEPGRDERVRDDAWWRPSAAAPQPPDATVPDGRRLPWSSPDGAWPLTRGVGHAPAGPSGGSSAGYAPAPTEAGGGAPAAYPPASDPPEPAGASAAQPYTWPAPGSWHSSGAREPAGPQEPRGRRRRGVAYGVVVLLVLVALLGGIVVGALGARLLWPSTSSGSALPAAGSPVSTGRAPDSVAGIAAAALESTVFIEVFGGDTASSGSGMVLREDGYLVTNNHVIDAAADGGGTVAVTLADGSQLPAEIVGRTADYDLAVLKVDEDGLTPLPLADSDAVVVGDPVVAVGAPLGLEGTVTSGIISALNRPVQAGGSGDGASFINAIQTDAAINPGNSGGPLINTAGEVIGINTAIAQAGGRQTGSIGLGFSIPSNQVRRTAEQIIETGRATYPVIGVALDTRYQGEGVQVLQDDAGAATPAVTPGGPGDEAGIEPGDVITHFDGQPVTTPSELIVAVRSRAPGDTVVLTVRSDGGDEREVEVVLDEAGSD